MRPGRERTPSLRELRSQTFISAPSPRQRRRSVDAEDWVRVRRRQDGNLTTCLYPHPYLYTKWKP
jgi:hypothetical protein